MPGFCIKGSKTPLILAYSTRKRFSSCSRCYNLIRLNKFYSEYIANKFSHLIIHWIIAKQNKYFFQIIISHCLKTLNNLSVSWLDDCLTKRIVNLQMMAWISGNKPHLVLPMIRWIAAEWEHCTKSCGSSGYQIRTVRCMHLMTDGMNRSVHSKYCTGERPESRRACNRKPCPAQWKTGPWLEVSEQRDPLPVHHTHTDTLCIMMYTSRKLGHNLVGDWYFKKRKWCIIPIWVSTSYLGNNTIKE